MITDNSFTFEGGPVALLLVHGLTGTPSEMKGIGKAIARRGYTVHGVQLAGHCGDEADLVRTGWRDWSRSVEAAFDRLRAKHETVYVGGLSMGALLSIKLAADRPGEVAGLALYSTTLFYDGWAIPKTRVLVKPALALGFAKWVRFVEAPPYGLKDDRIRERIARAMLGGDSASSGNAATPGRSLVELHRLSAEVKRALPSVRTPALVVHARHDDMTSLRNANYVASRIGGDVEKVILENSYHMVTLDRDRDHLVGRTVDFMGRQRRLRVAKNENVMPLRTARR
ncbi:alpha/beta hydrolase [Microvirga puerhi]|uniref:Alpha/beta fold hydrolase n=1 Tax=Microvirga puerhi TaxID=2876078 RepID=A0ABS7VUL3_9HYPH|nr:alpha/beta fold hydrolase [Microvirga puerhi]MBZ6078864.1 alpha/beta fold hydrolase [Microvirga puerhi]